MVDKYTLKFTGERMVPEHSGIPTFWAHIYRYRFALPFVKNKRVLDIACGEGYGTSSLQLAGAKNTIGIDISFMACKFAYQKYRETNIVGSGEEIPLSDNSVDLLISFETIEHLNRPLQFLKETKRVLSEKGILIISSPNKDVYDLNCNNEYHLNEFTKNEFIKSLRRYYISLKLFGQVPIVDHIFRRNSICARKIPKSDLPGIWRLEKIRKKIIPEVFNDPEDKRNDANLTILEKDNLYSKILNPYIVRPVFNISENYLYYIAVVDK